MKKTPKWKIIFAVCCLFYAAWVIRVGNNEFDRINRQYRNLVAQLDAGRISSVALEELAAECRRVSQGRTDLSGDACHTWPPAVVEAREKQVEERLLRARERGVTKVVLFYAGFVSIFLLAPPILTYLLIIAIILLYKNIKFVR
jgi:hypothetical protein